LSLPTFLQTALAALCGRTEVLRRARDRSTTAPCPACSAGGVFTINGDNAVHFIADGIDLTTWQNLSVPNDGQVIDATKL
jgi:hypothetical protein